jgi:hypothetical protein
MDERAGDERPTIRLMNEYSVTIPLWDDEGQTDGNELGLSDALRADLTSFARRWEATIPVETFDDRFDDVPVTRSVIDAWRLLRRIANPAGRRAARAEDVELRSLGEDLRGRLEHELGGRYRVIYQH